MSSSVWFEEVERALISFIQSNIFIGSDPVRCQIRKPDEDFKKEHYPLISIYNVYSKRDDIRRNYEVVPIAVDVDRKKKIVEKPSLPYNLFYQIDFWSLQQSQMNSMLYQWLLATDGGKYINLPVVDSGGNNRNQFCVCNDDLKKTDLMDGTNRIFHSYITYKVYAEIDENVRIEEPLITDIGVTTNPDQGSD